MALPAALANLLQTLDVGVLHELAADVGLGDEGEVILQPILALYQAGLQRPLIGTAGQALPVRELGIAPQHFKAHAHLVNAVVQGFQLCRLVHHILGLVTLPQSCSQAATRNS